MNNYTGNFNGPSSGSHEWYEAANDVALNNTTIAANEHVVLFVNGNLTINGRINLAQPHTSFFMAIVSGDIIVNPSVTNAGINPAMEGIYHTDGVFHTGLGDEPFIFHGSAVAMGGFDLQRDLLAANSTTPAEEFHFEPRQMINFPYHLTRNSIVWREVAP